MSIRRFLDSVLDGYDRAFTLYTGAAGNPGISINSPGTGNKFSTKVGGNAEVFSTLQATLSGVFFSSNQVVVSLVNPDAVTYLRFVNWAANTTTNPAGGGSFCDFSMFANLGVFDSGNTNMNPIKVKAGTALVNGTGVNGTIDASQVDCIVFDTSQSGNYASLVPPPPTRLQKMYLWNSRLATLVLTEAYTALTEVWLGDGGSQGINGGGSSLVTVNLSGVPNLVKLFANDTAALNFVFHANASAALVQLDLNRTRLGNTVFGGGFEAVRAVLAANTAATLLRFRQCGLNGAEQAALVACVWTNRASRPQTGTRTLQLDASSVTLCYPQDSGGFGGTRFNAGIVDAVTRARIADLRALGWTVGYNAPTLKIQASTTAGRLKLTYEGDQDIDIWAVGDTIQQTAAQAGGYLPNGNYTVVSGSGKVWEIAGSFAVAPGAVVVRGTFDK